MFFGVTCNTLCTVSVDLLDEGEVQDRIQYAFVSQELGSCKKSLMTLVEVSFLHVHDLPLWYPCFYLGATQACLLLSDHCSSTAREQHAILQLVVTEMRAALLSCGTLFQVLFAATFFLFRVVVGPFLTWKTLMTPQGSLVVKVHRKQHCTQQCLCSRCFSRLQWNIVQHFATWFHRHQPDHC